MTQHDRLYRTLKWAKDKGDSTADSPSYLDIKYADSEGLLSIYDLVYDPDGGNSMIIHLTGIGEHELKRMKAKRFVNGNG